MALRILRSLIAAAVYQTAELSFRETIDPSFKSVHRPFRYVLPGFRRSCDQVDIPELAVLNVQRIGTIQECLQLSAEFVIVNRCCEDDGLCGTHLSDHVVHVIPDHTFAGLLTCQAASAEVQILIFQRNIFHLISSFPCSRFCLSGQDLRVAPVSQA